jgi:hypothetical protein
MINDDILPSHLIDFYSNMIRFELLSRRELWWMRVWRCCAKRKWQVVSDVIIFTRGLVMVAMGVVSRSIFGVDGDGWWGCRRGFLDVRSVEGGCLLGPRQKRFGHHGQV